MSLTLIHTADWQIGRNFGTSGTLDVRKRTLLREARVTVIDRIAQAATQAAGDFGGSRHVLVAGDVFDSPTVPDPLLRQTELCESGASDAY